MCDAKHEHPRLRYASAGICIRRDAIPAPGGQGLRVSKGQGRLDARSACRAAGLTRRRSTGWPTARACWCRAAAASPAHWTSRPGCRTPPLHRGNLMAHPRGGHRGLERLDEVAVDRWPQHRGGRRAVCPSGAPLGFDPSHARESLALVAREEGRVGGDHLLDDVGADADGLGDDADRHPAEEVVQLQADDAKAALPIDDRARRQHVAMGHQQARDAAHLLLALLAAVLEGQRLAPPRVGEEVARPLSPSPWRAIAPFRPRAAAT